jgi:DNA-binding transcriptional regulator YhcF (GntR family)
VHELGITIDRGGREPASAQLTVALRRLIDAGGLSPGERLPTVRAFAADLGIVPNTVARAYRELEAGGYLVGRGRAGTFVTDEPPGPEEAPSLEDLANAYLARTRSMNVIDAEAVDAVRRVVDGSSGRRGGLHA